ncbi:hypothetical protein AYI69_g1299, partial [Smittium culicis]
MSCPTSSNSLATRFAGREDKHVVITVVSCVEEVTVTVR